MAIVETVELEYTDFAAPVHTVELVDAARATQLLKQNTKNRLLSKSTVAQYAAVMKDGGWLFDGAPIRVAKDGTILDGQHRLEAVVASDTVQQFSIWSGLEDETQHVTDTGRKRTFGDALKINGETDQNNKAALTSLLFFWEHGDRGFALTQVGYINGATMRPQIPALLEFFEKHREEITEGNRVAATVSGPANGLGITKRIAGLASILFSRIDAEDSEEFFRLLKTGEGLSIGDPVLVLRNRLIVENSKAQTQALHPAIMLALIIKAWNFWRDGASVGLIRFKPGGKGKETYPEPH